MSNQGEVSDFHPLTEYNVCYNTLKNYILWKVFQERNQCLASSIFQHLCTTAKLFCSLTFTPFSNMANNIHLCLQICDLFIFFQVKRINMFCNHVVLRRRQVILYDINEFFSQSNEALQPELNYSRIYLQNMKIECFSKEHKQFLVHSFSYFFSWILWFSHHVH